MHMSTEGKAVATRDQVFQALTESAVYEKTAAALADGFDRMVEELIELTEIPAPPFGEEKRGAAYKKKLEELGLTDVSTDSVGNVTAVRPGISEEAPMIAISAHLDTVFPEGTDVTVKRDGNILRAPGIGDDTSGLASILAYMQALDEADVETENPILVVATVGEEGQGDLRGMRHVFSADGAYRDRISALISMDGAFPDQRIVRGGTGSRRYRITFKGPGGHSFNDAGIVNPMYAAAQTMMELGHVPLKAEPKTTCNPTVVSGGTSINAIPESVELLVDLRANASEDLDDLDASFARIIPEACDAENKARSTHKGEITAEIEPLGFRPVGETPVDSDLVAYAKMAISAIGLSPDPCFSSTDSNVPMSVGVPAVTLSWGADGDGSHTLAEWRSVEKGPSVRGMTIGLATLMSMARAKV
jgi:tripeptide aminopeptidase